MIKKGNPSLLTNYRPIALLSAVGKVCERLVYNKLYRFVTPVLSENQSGFRKKDGTAFQLTRLMQKWSNLLDDSHYIGVLFFDLRKAFDKVWHRGLLAKLKACGVTGAALNWFKSYLSNRQQCVKVNQSISSPLQIHAGIPQGAILSPLLFIIYMNDISQAAPKGSSVNLFADDTSLYVNDTCPRQLANELQHAADCLSSWFTKWLPCGQYWEDGDDAYPSKTNGSTLLSNFCQRKACSTGSHTQTPRTHHRTHTLVDSSSYLGLLKSSEEDRTTTPFQKSPFQFINPILVHDINPANLWRGLLRKKRGSGFLPREKKLEFKWLNRHIFNSRSRLLYPQNSIQFSALFWIN